MKKKILTFGASNSTRSINKKFAAFAAGELEDVEVTLNAMREELHLYAKNAGSMVGPITLIDSGDEIPIEQRAAEEITHGFGSQTGPDGIEVYNPAFDVTPAKYVKAIITEKGVISPVDREHIAAIVK